MQKDLGDLNAAVREAQEVKGAEYKMINGGYPRRILLGIPGKSGDEPSAVIDPETGKSGCDILSEDAQSAIEKLSDFSEEEKEQFGIPDEEALNAMTDEEIPETFNSGKGGSEWTTYDEYAIPAYNTTAMKNTRWNGWCGPSAISWIYRGLYSSYNGTYIPLACDNGFYNPTGRFTSGSKGYYVL